MHKFTELVDALFKARGHKYLKRIPYESRGKLRYRYIYKITHTHKGKHAFHEDHLVEGTKFALSTQSGEEFHGHITSVDGDKIKYVIDDGPRKGEEVTTTREKLAKELHEKHDVHASLKGEREEVERQLAYARKKGYEKQEARLLRRLDALKPKETKKPEPRVFSPMSEADLDALSLSDLSRVTEQHRAYLREVDQIVKDDPRIKKIIREFPDQDEDAQSASITRFMEIQAPIQEKYRVPEVKKELERIVNKHREKKKAEREKKKAEREAEAKKPRVHGTDISKKHLEILALSPKKRASALSKLSDTEIKRLADQYAESMLSRKSGVDDAMADARLTYKRESRELGRNARYLRILLTPSAQEERKAKLDAAKAKLEAAKADAKQKNPYAAPSLGKAATLKALIDESHARMYQVKGTTDERLGKLAYQLRFNEFTNYVDDYDSALYDTNEEYAQHYEIVFNRIMGTKPTASERYEIRRRMRGSFRKDRDGGLPELVAMSQSIKADGIDLPGTADAVLRFLEERGL